MKKILLSFLTFLVLFYSVAPKFQTVNAADPITQEGQDVYNLWNHKWYSEQNPFAWYQKVYDETQSPESDIFGERYTAAQVQWVIYSIWAYLWNIFPGNPQLTTCFLTNSSDVSTCYDVMKKYLDVLNPLNTSSTRSNETTASGIFAIGESPISGIYYFKQLINKLSLVSEAKAQEGFGYASARPALELWRAARDISFFFLIIAVIVLAFMVMFQVKISPQAVISIQMAIPKLIITLILVTFSYAIAGLMIDLMYITIGVLASALSSTGLSGATTPQLFQDMISRNGFVLMYSYWIHLIGATASTLFSGFGLGIILFLVSIIMILAVLWWSLKIIWMLIKNFAMIILTIAVGPIEIMMGSMTSSLGFGPWFKRLLSYLAVYPVTILMFFLSFFFLQQGNNASASIAENTPFNPAVNIITDNSTWIPPLSFLTTTGDRLIWILVSIVIFSEITKAAEIIQGFISGRPFAFGTGLAEAEKSPVSQGGQAMAREAIYTNILKGPAGVATKGGWGTVIGSLLKLIPVS